MYQNIAGHPLARHPLCILETTKMYLRRDKGAVSKQPSVSSFVQKHGT